MSLCEPSDFRCMGPDTSAIKQEQYNSRGKEQQEGTFLQEIFISMLFTMGGRAEKGGRKCEEFRQIRKKILSLRVAVFEVNIRKEIICLVVISWTLV